MVILFRSCGRMGGAGPSDNIYPISSRLAPEHMSEEEVPSKIIDDDAAADIKKVLDALASPVRLVVFTAANDDASMVQLKILREMAALSTKVSLEELDLHKDASEAESYAVEMTPCTIVRGEKDHRIRFYGVTSGMEFPTLLEDVLMVSFKKTELDPQLEEMVRGISVPVHIRVMVTLTCPYCPRMVRLAHQFAYLNENIKGDMVEASQFQDLSQRYDVHGVPHTVINETFNLQGAMEAGPFYLQVLKAVDPEQYKELEEVLREVEGKRKVRKADEGHLYDLTIIGAGPAGMSAAIYAVRKGLDTLVVAKKLGGQVTYTSDVDNYLGLPGLDGDALTSAFRDHMESYEVAEAIGHDVISISIVKGGFETVLEGGTRFRSKTLLYCAGKEYRRLNIPSEIKYIGRGVRFCATCDAPLYKGKKVAVVGGGNTALTAVRDLMGMAEEVHVIHRRKDFRGDAALMDAVLKASNVKFHVPMVVIEYLGEERMTGLRLEPVGGGPTEDLMVEGVFLGIGLDPNSSPVRGLVPFNGLGEIPANKDQSTSVPGFYVAGDVSDVPEKQISIAVGQGALAAISVYRYLMSTGQHETKGIEKDTWQ
jgi:alkyl hydroperoxide reductase subunit F